MKCPDCNGKTRVTTTYWNKSNSNRRRRECVHCYHRFTTREIIQIDTGPEDDPRQIPLELDVQEESS